MELWSFEKFSDITGNWWTAGRVSKHGLQGLFPGVGSAGLQGCWMSLPTQSTWRSLEPAVFTATAREQRNLWAKMVGFWSWKKKKLAATKRSSVGRMSASTISAGKWSDLETWLLISLLLFYIYFPLFFSLFFLVALHLSFRLAANSSSAVGIDCPHVQNKLVRIHVTDFPFPLDTR